MLGHLCWHPTLHARLARSFCVCHNASTLSISAVSRRGKLLVAGVSYRIRLDPFGALMSRVKRRNNSEQFLRRNAYLHAEFSAVGRAEIFTAMAVIGLLSESNTTNTATLACG